MFESIARQLTLPFMRFCRSTGHPSTVSRIAENRRLQHIQYTYKYVHLQSKILKACEDSEGCNHLPLELKSHVSNVIFHYREKRHYWK
jgi:hypothetical protein